MASYSALHVDNNSSGSYQSDEFSLLNEVGDGLYPNGGNNHVNFDFTNMHSTLNERAHESNEEVSSQLTKLISDNLTLKEALDKNNSMMKEQLSTIPAWRDLMIFKTQQHQQKLQEAEQKIASLEEENNKLREKPDNILGEMGQNRDFCTRCVTLESTLNSLFGEKDFTEKDRSLLCSELNSFYGNLEQNLTVICHHLNILLKSKMKENEKNLLKTFILLLKFKISALNGSFCATVQTDEETGYEIVHQMVNKEESVKERSQVNSEIFKKIEDLKESLAKKDEELDLIRNEKSQLAEEVKVYNFKIQELERASKAQFEILSAKLKNESLITEKYKEQCEILQQQYDEYQVKLDRAKMSGNYNVHELRQEIHNLQEILKIEQRASQRDKEELSRININYEKLQVDYERVTKLLEVVSRDEKEKIEKLQMLNESNEKAYQENIDRLTAELLEVQEQLNESNAEAREIKGKLSLVAEESETIPVLKAQVEVYKRDFFNTDAARKSAQEEVERLTNEIKRYQENSGSGSRNSSPSSSRRNECSSTTNKDHKDVFECPVCQNTFTCLSAAENHINRCLEGN